MFHCVFLLIGHFAPFGRICKTVPWQINLESVCLIKNLTINNPSQGLHNTYLILPIFQKKYWYINSFHFFLLISIEIILFFPFSYLSKLILWLFYFSLLVNKKNSLKHKILLYTLRDINENDHLIYILLINKRISGASTALKVRQFSSFSFYHWVI